MRVFRDKTSLPATADLRSSVYRALAKSSWFVLVASPGSAASEWVTDEISWWLDNKSAEYMIIVRACGDIDWDESGADFNWERTTAISRALRGAIRSEPFIVDATWAPSKGPIPQGIPELRDSVFTVGAAIRQMNKDELLDLDDREHRRTMRLARAAQVGLATLLVIAIAAAAVAGVQRDQARNQARLATARELAALSETDLTTHLDLAQLLAVAAYQMDDDPQTEAALFQAASASPQLVRFLQAGAPVVALGTAADGKAVVAGTATGRLVRFDLETGSRQSVLTGPAAITDVAASADGDTVVAADGHQVFAWDASGGAQPQRIASGSNLDQVAVSPSGQLAAFDSASSTGAGHITVRNLITGRQVRAAVPRLFDRVTFVSASTVLALTGDGEWETLSLPRLREISRGGRFLLPATGGYSTGFSPDDAYTGYAEYGSVIAWHTRDIAHTLSSGGLAPVNVASSVAISPDGTRTAVVEGGIIYVGALSRAVPRQTGLTSTRLVANSDTSDVTFLGGDDRLVSVTGDAIALWDLSRSARLARPTGISVPVAALYGLPPELTFSPNGRAFVLVGGDGGMSVFRIGRVFTRLGSWGSEGSSHLAVWEGNRPRLARQSAGGITVLGTDGSVLGTLPRVPLPAYVIAAQSVPGGRVVVVDQSGTVAVGNINSGAFRQIPGRASGLQAQMTAISPDGTSVVECDQAQGQVLLINTGTGATRVIGSGNADGVVFADHRLFIERASGALQIWNATGSDLLETLAGAGGYASALSVSPKGSLVASLGNDGVVSVLSLPSGRQLAAFALPVPPDAGESADPWLATAIQFTPNGRDLLTATAGGQVLSWDVYPPDMAKIACSIVGRPLTTAEWQQSVGTTQPAPLPCKR